MKQSAILVLGSSFLLAFAAEQAMARTAADQALGQWRNYAINSIKPDFDWAGKQDSQALKPTVLANAMSRSGFTAASRFDFTQMDMQSGFGVGVSRQVTSDRAGSRERNLKLPEFSNAQDVQRDLLAPSFQTQFAGNQMRASVILAEQQFAFWKLGSENLLASESPGLALSAGGTQRSNGVGFRVEGARPLNDHLALRANAQSRIDMDAFMAYRGIFTEAGDFDIPASFGFGLDWTVIPSHTLSVGIERVYFSSIKPFTSNALPDEFIGLLGDGGSPVFAWRDLDVYSLAWQWMPSQAQSFELRYSTSQQPLATSPILNFVLQDQVSDSNFAAQFTQRITDNGSIGFSAAYSGAQSYLGYSGNTDVEYRNHQLEANLVWTQKF